MIFLDHVLWQVLPSHKFMCGSPQNDTTSSFFSLHPNCGKSVFRFTIMCSENNTLRQSEMRHSAVLVEISQWNTSSFLPGYTVSHTRTGSSQKFSLLWRLVISLYTLIWLPSMANKYKRDDSCCSMWLSSRKGTIDYVPQTESCYSKS